ncbi:division/cell wall cluster transcriptional repressor MraZ [Proteiniclasticum ruminis]|uniref:Transcriptional regulator MraZ n=1 Tax=Proteiniclasticum ruminis TaxID=398199 RepID=A0A1G8GAM8_9CLOT|nr:division/cell wall cluster transcriptional repressor MraZ [Proteiniclasticum ruminis]MBP9920819.1 division/cell wall cluster transcriptional repressor MraZ [Proteiniclasticum sp.]SDH91437.1 MraZ protein [Proteiniclasticum ruminis]
MLIGEFSHGMDKKNRIIIPAKLRDGLGDTFIMTKGLDSCLYIYPKSEWEVFEKKLKALPMTDKNVRAFVRFFFSGANEMEPDKMGRVLIPQSLLSYAGIEGEVVSVGMMDRVEVWSKEKWTAYNESDMDMDTIAAKMNELGI